MGHQGHKTGGRKAGRPNNRTLERHEAAAETVALIGELIPDAFAGDTRCDVLCQRLSFWP